MIEVLAALTRSMRALMLGPNPPASLDALRVAALAGATEPQQALLKIDAASKFFRQLASAVFEGQTYSEVGEPAYVEKMRPETRTLWDAACRFEPVVPDVAAP